MNDDEIKNMLDLQSSLYKNGQNIEKSVELTVLRDGKEIKLSTKLMSQEELNKNNNSLKSIFGTNSRNQKKFYFYIILSKLKYLKTIANLRKDKICEKNINNQKLIYQIIKIIKRK